MVPVNAIAFVVLKILHDLVLIQKPLLANNGHKKRERPNVTISLFSLNFQKTLTVLSKYL